MKHILIDFIRKLLDGKEKLLSQQWSCNIREQKVSYVTITKKYNEKNFWWCH